MPLPNQMPSNLIYNPVLTDIAIVYKNPTLIAELVCPTVEVDTPDFKYTVRNKVDDFTIVDTLTGRKSKPNEVEFTDGQATASVEDHFIDGPVPRRDQDMAVSYGTPTRPKARMAEVLTNKLLLGKEQRTANVITNPANYATANKTTLTGTAQWSDPNSDPIGAMNSVFDTLLVRPNTGVISRVVLSKLLSNPDVVQAFHGNNGAVGRATTDFLKEQLGLTNLYVGESWYNSSNPGQNGTLARLWGKNAAFFYQDPAANETDSLNMFIRAQWGERIVTEFFDPNRGGRGSDVLRVGEAVKELALAPDLGYLFQNAVA